MTLYEFKFLDKNEQAQAVWELGEHVATRTTAKYKILLWIIEDFYVELVYDFTENKIEKIRTFRNPDLLSPYLDQIDISEIYKWTYTKILKAF